MAFLDYVAGLFDGEGSVSLARRTRQLSGNETGTIYTPFLSLAQSDRPILEKVRETIGSGSLCVHSKGESSRSGVRCNKDVYQLIWSNKAAADFAEVLIPQTYNKRSQLQLVRDFYVSYSGLTRGWSRWRHQNPEYYRRTAETTSAAETCRQKLIMERNLAA